MVSRRVFSEWTISALWPGSISDFLLIANPIQLVDFAHLYFTI
jgi:hypothetical protein